MKVRTAILLSLCVGSAAFAQAPLKVGEEVIKAFETRHPYVRAEAGRPEVVWSETLSYPNAAYIAVHFAKFSVGPGDAVIVRSPDGVQSWKYEGLGRGKQGLSAEGFWAVHVKGPAAVVELISSGNRGASDYGFHIDRFARGYQREEMEAQGLVMAPESICGPDDALPAKCYQGSEPQIYDRSRAIARLLSGGTAFCTGWLVGNAGQLMTNNHCVDTNSGAINTDYEFMAEGATCGTICGPNQCPGIVVDGASLVQTSALLDYSLIQLATNPTATYGFLKMRTSGAMLDERIYVLGHPNGEGKQIVAASTDPHNPSGWCEMDSTAATPCVSGSAFPDMGYFCDTEPGSSGSAVLAYSDHKVVSLHHCGGCPSDVNTGLDIVDIIADLNAQGHLPPGSTFEPVGSVQLDRGLYGCSDTIAIEVRDDNLANTGTTSVTIHSTAEPIDETVQLIESPAGTARFVGTIATTSAPAVQGDGLLSVANGNTIGVTYIDATDGAGGTNVPRTNSAGVDCVGPVISNVHFTDVQGTSAVLRWNTNELADSRADYGLSTNPPPSQTVSSPNDVQVHALLLTGLVPCNDYIVRVESQDPQGNTATDDNGGLYYVFNSGISSSPTYAAGNLPLTIPTSSATPTAATITVPDNKAIVDVNVKLNITHSYDGDMTISLRHPDGTVVALSNRRGASGQNYTNTVFDDSASTPISGGGAPFTGSFIPDSPLSALNGKNALGTWKVEVLDSITGDGGSFDSAEITLTYPAQTCGPDAAFETTTLVADDCVAGGSGDANGFWDDGETATLRVSLRNSGTTGLTGITATITPVTAGVVVLDDTASYPDLAPEAVAASVAPDFTAKLPEGFACGDPVQFSIAIHSNQGTFTDTVSAGVAGQLLGGSGDVLVENFGAGIPGTWTVIDGGTGGGAAATWTTANPGGRVAVAPMDSSFAIVDSDSAGSGAAHDEALITPVLDLSTASAVTLEFDQYFHWYSLGTNEKGDVDVRSSLTGGAWLNVFRNVGGDSANPEHRAINITSSAAGASDVQVRFRYYDAHYEWYWMIDNVRVSYTGASACNMASCVVTTPPGEVSSEWFADGTTLAWTPAPLATSYNVYRGRDIDLPKLSTGQTESCLHGTTSATSLGSITVTPPVSQFDWWLVRAANNIGEGPAGNATAGPRVQDPTGICP